MSVTADIKPIDFKNYSILIVDDTPTNLSVLVDYLEKCGFEIMVARNGKMGIKRAQIANPDIILLDVMMPGINGFETCKELKKNAATSNIPVIFMTALESVEDKVKGFEVGGVDYITKPIQHEEVLARITTHLRIRDLTISLNAKIEELTQTRHELIQSEKMAALGQLIAGIAHEINTPLGVIRSSIGNIADFLKKTLVQLPKFFQQLSEERQQDFFALLKKTAQIDNTLSIKEKRRLKNALINQLEKEAIEDADTIAISLIGIGIYEITPFLSLLRDKDRQAILENAYQLASLQKSTEAITISSDRASKIVFALKNFAHFDSSGEKVQANLTECIDTVLILYHNQLKQEVIVTKHYDSLPPIRCYPDELNQVWVNLIHNALQAMDYKGALTIEVKQKAEQVSVNITDNGKGIAPEIQSKIFEPFFTTKPAGEGSGLGLDIVKRIIEKHEGKIEVESLPGKTTFTVFLPLVS
ncbi:response regulator [Candidatus Marithioploca araucensis]|uniref:histidine kinase n=1 Tax=Candidatus Marithioploca araucensis TaxID=70273 RepID=A0ABT7VQR3_9GAMM|nr:response regulator [Candidatus Marithioploca araucensis]